MAQKTDDRSQTTFDRHPEAGKMSGKKKSEIMVRIVSSRANIWSHFLPLKSIFLVFSRLVWHSACVPRSNRFQSAPFFWTSERCFNKTKTFLVLPLIVHNIVLLFFWASKKWTQGAWFLIFCCHASALTQKRFHQVVPASPQYPFNRSNDLSATFNISRLWLWSVPSLVSGYHFFSLFLISQFFFAKSLVVFFFHSIDSRLVKLWAHSLLTTGSSDFLCGKIWNPSGAAEKQNTSGQSQ